MCLGIPGKVVRWIHRETTFAQAEVEFAGVSRVCHMACVPEATEGDYVIVHAGIAISRIDPEEAQRIFQELQSLDDHDGWTEESLP
ncbi:MAG: HypC/HybG/HupF family hydrogenase formation chaperone [Planctomycetaceae bacterium]